MSRFDSDLDHAEWLNGPEPPEVEPLATWEDEPAPLGLAMEALDAQHGPEPPECETCGRATTRTHPSGFVQCSDCAEAAAEADAEGADAAFAGGSTPQTDAERAIQAHRDRTRE